MPLFFAFWRELSCYQVHQRHLKNIFSKKSQNNTGNRKVIDVKKSLGIAIHLLKGKGSTWIFAQMLQNALNADQVYLNSANLMTLFSSQIQEPSFESKLWGGVKSIGVTKVILQDSSHFFLGLWIIKSFCGEVNSHISGNIRENITTSLKTLVILLFALASLS